MRALALLLGAAVSVAAGAAPPSQSFPGDSVYLLRTVLTDQSGAPAALDRYRGHPVLISMFYGSCPNVCPLLISTIQRQERELDDAQRKNLRVLLVSLDPAVDTSAKLTEVAGLHHIDLQRWTLARTDDSAARKLAAVLNIQYRRLPDGTINHSTVITLLDPEGRIVDQTSSMLRPDSAFMDILRKAPRH